MWVQESHTWPTDTQLFFSLPQDHRFQFTLDILEEEEKIRI